MTKRTWIAWLLSMISLAACAPGSISGGPTQGVTFRSIDQIVDGDLKVVDFADGTARLPVTTSVPVACSIVYGATPEFGSLAVDLDMAGGAHSEHNPLLTGLKSNTVYYYRMQGVDSEGNVYISGVMTFTTPGSETARGASENLASPQRGTTITGYSSIFGNGPGDGLWGVSNALDGNSNTEWATAGDGSNAWVEVRLANRAHVTAIEFWSRAMGDCSSIKQAFTVAADAKTVFGPYSIPDTTGAHRFEVDFEALTLRFDLVDTTGGNTGAVDIAVYGDFADSQ